MKLPVSKGVLYLVLAGLVGLVATFIVHRYISMKTEVARVAMGQVAIAAADVSPGSALNGGNVKVAPWPKEFIPPQSASSLKEVEGLVTLRPLAKGEPILLSKLAPKGTAAGLGALLESNERAVTVRVDDVSAVAGFIHPGDHVDILVDMPVPNTQEHFSKTILQNLVVLSCGQTWEQKGDLKPLVVNSVTLKVTPEQAEVLNLASNQGRIRLALRNPNNVAASDIPGVTTTGIITPRGAMSQKQHEGRSVEVIRGLERTKVVL